MDNAVALAGNEIARAIGVRGEVPEEASVGQVFAERLNDLLVVLFLRTVGAVPHDHRIGSRTIGIHEYGADKNRRSDRFGGPGRSEEHTSELQSLMRISYA